ncbi:hypothetical protein JCM10207_003165 [Rhodosporidiobolus poonsookiae]
MPPSSLSFSLPHFVLHPLAALPLPAFLRPSKLGGPRSLVLGLSLGFSLSLSLTGLALYALDRWRRALRRGLRRQVTQVRREEVVLEGAVGLIGNTPLVRINSLSDRLGVEIYGKCEYMNPFGSVKDRVSLKIIQQAEEEGLIHPHTGSCIFEGTSGSTGISIAGIARARGYKAHIILPDDVSREKIDLLSTYGAVVEPVRPVSIVDRRHYVNLARQRALEFGSSTVRATESAEEPGGTPRAVSPHRRSTGAGAGAGAEEGEEHQPDLLVTSAPAPRAPTRPPSPAARGSSFSFAPASTQPEEAYVDPPRGLFADQFETLSNFAAHYEGTAPEIWEQVKGRCDAFVSGAGTGGTIAGVGRYLKEKTEGRCEVVLADPQGSGLYHKIHDGVMYAETESEGKRRRHQVDTIVEGIGLNRITRNLSQALPLIDDAFRVSDPEALSMSRHLALHDGLFLGSSSAVNLVACVRLARKWAARDARHASRRRRGAEPWEGAGERKVVVTVLCDSGARHTSRFWNPTYVSSAGLSFPDSIDWLFDEPVELSDDDEDDGASAGPDSASVSSDEEGEEGQGEREVSTLELLKSDEPGRLGPLPRELVEVRP